MIYTLSEFTTQPFFIQYGFHNSPLSRHCHSDFIELVIVLSGHALHEVEHSQTHISKGDVFVIGPDTHHAYLMVNDFMPCNIMFSKHFIDQHLKSLMQSVSFQALFHLEPQLSSQGEFESRLSLGLSDFNTIKNLTDQLLDEYHQTNIGREEMLSSLFLQLITQLCRLYDPLKNGRQSQVMHLAKAMAMIESHYTESLKLEVLADETGYSKRHFNRLFQHYYGTSPVNYVNNLRIKKAANLLIETNWTALEIAFRCGFSDGNYFNRFFKKHYHLTPIQYRKRYKA